MDGRVRVQAMLFNAVRAGDVEKAREALAMGADARRGDPKNRGEHVAGIWCQAASAGAGPEMAGVLSEAMDPTEADGSCWTAFHWAASFDSEELLSWLLERYPEGASVFSSDEMESPLHVAARVNSEACCRLLLAAGADPGEQCPWEGGKNAFGMAAAAATIGDQGGLMVLARMSPSHPGWDGLDNYGMTAMDRLADRVSSSRGRTAVLWGGVVARVREARAFHSVANVVQAEGGGKARSPGL